MFFPVWSNHFWLYTLLQHFKNSVSKNWPWVPLQGESGCSSVDFHSRGCSRSLCGLLERCDLLVLTQTRASGLQGPENRNQKWSNVITDNRVPGRPLQEQIIETLAETMWCLLPLKHIVFSELINCIYAFHFKSLCTSIKKEVSHILVSGYIFLFPLKKYTVFGAGIKLRTTKL